MSIRSRFQAPPIQSPDQNPNLKPLPPRVDPWTSRGRFQNVNLPSSAEERTRVQNQNVVFQEKKTTSSGKGESEKEETTTVVEE